MSEVLLVALIEALGMVLAAIITGLSVVFGAIKLAKNKKLRTDLVQAYKDIQAFCVIEQFHIEINTSSNGVSNKVHVRKLVETEKGLLLSGKNTPAQVKRKISALESIVD